MQSRSCHYIFVEEQLTFEHLSTGGGLANVMNAFISAFIMATSSLGSSSGNLILFGVIALVPVPFIGLAAVASWMSVALQVQQCMLPVYVKGPTLG